MRAVFLVLILVVLLLIAAIATGWLDIRQVRGARAPDVNVENGAITATGGQAPAFDVDTGSVAVGTRPANVTVQVPEVAVVPPSNQSNQAEPAPAGN